VGVCVPHEIFERKPILGVLLGVAGLGLSLVAYYVVQREYRSWGKTPVPADLKTVTPPPELHGQWVKVTQPLRIDCQPFEIENQAEHQLLFGRVESTYFLAKIEGSERFVILERRRKANCEDVQRAPYVGVLTDVNSRLRSTLESKGMVFPDRKMMMLLCLSCGPREARELLVCFLILMGLSAWMIARFWRKHQRMVRFRRAFSLGPSASI
jgi:hypothetical protein